MPGSMPGSMPAPIPLPQRMMLHDEIVQEQMKTQAIEAQKDQQKQQEAHQHLVTGIITTWGEKAELPEQYFQYQSTSGEPMSMVGYPRAPTGSGYKYYSVHPKGAGFYKNDVAGDPWKEYYAEHGAPKPEIVSQIQQISAAGEAQYQARLQQVQTGGLRDFRGVFSDYGQRYAIAPVGTPIPSQQEYMKIQQLRSGKAVFGSEAEFKQVATPLSQYGAFAGITELRGSIVSPAPMPAPTQMPTMGEYLSRQGSPLPSSLAQHMPQQQIQAGFKLPLLSEVEKPFYTPKSLTGTFNILEGRTMQTYQWTKEASFGKSLFGKPQGAPEMGATYRKSWFGEYFKAGQPQARIVTQAGFESIRAADIFAPMFVTSGVFTSTAGLKGASLGINLLPKIKSLLPSKNVVSTSGFAGRMSEYAKVPTFEPRTFKTWLQEPSGYKSGSAEAFYKRQSYGFIKSDETFGLYSKEPPLETRTSLQVIDKRQFGFKGTGGFEITPKEAKAEPLGKMMGDLGKGRQSQALIQLPQAQKTITEQIKPAVILKTEQVFSRSKLESMGAYRSSTSFGSMAMPKSNVFSGLRPSKTALMLSDITYESYRYPPGKKTKQGIYTSSQLKSSQNLIIGGITSIKPAQILSITPATITPTATGTSLKTSQRTTPITQQAIRISLVTPQITRQTTRTTLKTPTLTTTETPFMPRIKIPPFAPSFNIFQTMRRERKGKTKSYKFPELARVATPRQAFRGFDLFGTKRKTSKKGRKKARR